MLKIILFCVAIAFVLPAFCQEKPAEDDKSAYAQAHELMNPELYMEQRARKAVVLLTEGREIKSLESRELALLCHAYNELFEHNEQLKTARLLWTREPEIREATSWMINSLHNSYMFADDNKPLMDFVDQALHDGKGNRRELLTFKAMATINQKKGLSDAEKRVLASDLLIEAYRYDPQFRHGSPLGESELKDAIRDDSPDFIDRDLPFCSFFSTAERNSLKIRMREAKAERKAKQSQKKDG
ncbi:hypothetical protein Pan258_09520 [Symmachiella dynata]|uniref:Uncharacterized protein n=1 Tax=Symmachiella dynata TaxID=2527995 RepID=A0A517ZIW7_9PLAN|nr:hypothetical protein [Symmachiella dynata]QDT46927.1 hypothetical protein Pan258_09520 [Symmachiella dynata]QDU42430.1 hypothetical protein Mal52_08910 [Symmachiella dynata]